MIVVNKTTSSKGSKPVTLRVVEHRTQERCTGAVGNSPREWNIILFYKVWVENTRDVILVDKEIPTDQKKSSLITNNWF